MDVVNAHNNSVKNIIYIYIINEIAYFNKYLLIISVTIGVKSFQYDTMNRQSYVPQELASFLLLSEIIKITDDGFIDFVACICHFFSPNLTIMLAVSGSHMGHFQSYHYISHLLLYVLPFLFFCVL